MLNFKRTIMNKSKKGNTLAELLICLAILGVVFTIAVGVMVADHNRNQTVVRLKKHFSTLSQAFPRAAAIEGPYYTWDIPSQLSEQGSNYFFEKYLKPNLAILRDCKNSTEGSCNFTFKELDGTEKALNSTWSRFYLNDGAFLAVQTYSNDKYSVVYFYVDSNGKKRLNVVARDIFMFEFWLENEEHPEYIGKLLPYGHEYSREELISDSNKNNCNRTKNGNYCSALIMKDGWQIKNGYPWAQARYVVQ